MKSIIRVPTEQYAYVEVEFEGSEFEIMEKYRELSNIYKNVSVGLTPKEFNRVLDNYLGSANLAEEEYNAMSLDQQKVIQELKKAFKRAEAKAEKGVEEHGNLMKALMEDTDRALEHEFHETYDEKCSECYKGRILKDKEKK